MYWVNDTWSGILLYADDIVMMAEDGEQLQRMLDVAGDYAKRWKLRFNSRKRKVMVTGGGHTLGRWLVEDGRGGEIQIS